MNRLVSVLTFAMSIAGFSVDAYARSFSKEGDINVRDFGAKGDGITDDSAAFTAAGNELWRRAEPMARNWGHLNCIKPSGSIEGPRPRIVVPRGRYLFKETACMHSDIVVVGEDGAELIGSNPTNDIFYLHGCYRVRLENLTFRGGRHSIFAETRNKESANIRITHCKFYDSADVALLSPSYRSDKGAISEWNYDGKSGIYTRNQEYLAQQPKQRNAHSSMIVVDNCAFENCQGCISISPDGSVIRNSTLIMPKGTKAAAICAGDVMHAYGLTIVHHAGSAAFRDIGNRMVCMFWLEDSCITTADGSGARVFEGGFKNTKHGSHIIINDVKTDAGLATDNAICNFDGAFPAISALVRVTAEGPNPVRSFTFGPVADEAAFKGSNKNNRWELDQMFSYGTRDCGKNILPIEEGCYAKRFERPVPDWAAPAGDVKCHLEAPKLENAKKIVYPGSWQVCTMTQEIDKDTIIDARGVAALVGMSSDRPWFVVKKGAKAVFRNLQVRGGKSFVVVEDGGVAYVETCFSYDAEKATFVCQKGGRLIVDNGVYYAPRLYEGEGDAFIRSIWYRFTEVVTPDKELIGGASMVNRGRLVVWDLLGVPTVFGRFPKEFAADDPVKRYDFRWVDNYGDYKSRMMRYGGEWGGLTSIWHYNGAKTLFEGHHDWYWNRSVSDTSVICETPNADVKAFAVNFCLFRQFLKYIGLMYRDQNGKDIPCDSSGLKFTCPAVTR